MLLLLVGILLLASILVLCVKRSRESMFLFGMCVSLVLQFGGISIFIAKKGGYSKEIMEFLLFSKDIKIKVQYMLITLDKLGYLIALGRSLFPAFLIQMALHYSMIPNLRRNAKIKIYIMILPIVSLIIYYPYIYSKIIDYSPKMQALITEVTYYWILFYVITALLLLIHEYFSITMKFCRYRFSQIVMCLVGLSGLYLLYCRQDPGQVYRFYSFDFKWFKGIGYMQYAPNVNGYIILVFLNIICSTLGFISLLKYTQSSFLNNRDDIVLQRKFDVAQSGASVFVHSIKNQLLANRVLEKRIFQELDKENPNLTKIKDGMNSLYQGNEMLLSRSEELYHTVKNKTVKLVPVSLEKLEETTLERFYKKHPAAKIESDLNHCIEVLADCNYLSEAIYNLLANGWEANVEAGNAELPVQMYCHSERLYTVIEVRDFGKGITRNEQKKIFEPFYSNKNSNYNWGMGLYHVRVIIKSHMGSLRIESQKGKGTSFFILLPKFGELQKRR